MQKFIEVNCRSYIPGVTERQLIRKDKIVSLYEYKTGDSKSSIGVDTGQKVEAVDVSTPYDEIKAALVNDEEWAKKVAKRAVYELQLIAGSEGTTAEIYEAFERRLTEILKGED